MFAEPALTKILSLRARINVLELKVQMYNMCMKVNAINLKWIDADPATLRLQSETKRLEIVHQGV